MTNSQSSLSSKGRSQRRLARVIILGGLVLILISLGLKGWRINGHITALRGYQADAEAMLVDGRSGLDGEQLLTITQGIRQETSGLIIEVEPFLWLTPYLGWLPRVGPLMPAARDLLIVADAGTEMLATVTAAVYPAADILATTDDGITAALPAILPVIGEADTAFAATRPDLARLTAAVNRIDRQPEVVAALPWTVRQQWPQLVTLLPLADDGLIIASALPDLAGQEAPKTYLLVAQNEDELRPTGGFLSSAGIITVAQGQIVNLDVRDSYEVDNVAGKPYDLPPQPLQAFMNADLFVFRDANFWPDFPTSARTMMDLYTYGREVPVDGVIAIDQTFLASLVEALEPVEVPELGVSLTGETLIEEMRAAWSAGDGNDENWNSSRESFVGPMALAIQQRLTQNLDTVDPILLAQSIDQSLRRKHLQIYVTDQELNERLKQAGWNGQITAPPGQDLLFVVDTNIGFNKANAAVSLAIEYDIELVADRTAAASTRLHYTHPGLPETSGCQQQVPVYSDGPISYESIINRCYWNYLRLYTPLGSQLTAASEHPLMPGQRLNNPKGWPGVATTVTSEDLALGVFAHLLTVPSGGETTAEFDYTIPTAWRETETGTGIYTLRLYKQAGRKETPVYLRITLPPGQQLIASSLSPTTSSSAIIEFNLSLQEDTVINLTFE